MTVRGIDVSSYQPSTYNTNGRDFVFVKATEGTSYINPRQSAQAAQARRNGLVVGFYHFL
ncbi:GH25 family lysozyme, partial [Streptomyces sp. NPDC090442]|uniref:GH25 family lysozyme n=1 Tax=Streptomyces sp. NPDC090442 TaxID=3365962 RepID=UPI0038149EBD